MPKETISVIGNHERLAKNTKTFLRHFGFETEGPAHFTIEIKVSRKPRILHNDQEELAGFLCAWFQDFGMYEVVQKEKPLKRSNLTIYASSQLCNIEAAAFAKLIAQAVKEYYR